MNRGSSRVIVSSIAPLMDRENKETLKRSVCCVLLTILVVFFPLMAYPQQPPGPSAFKVTMLQTPGRPDALLELRVQWSIQPQESQVVLFETSSNLVDWQEIAVVLQTPFTYPLPNTLIDSTRFFRASAVARASTNDWSNQLVAFYDFFWRSPDCETRDQIQWAKFVILPEQPGRVYFQDNHQYLLHYDFAVQQLPSAHGMSTAEFNSLSLYRAHQRFVLGTVLAPMDGSQIGIQFTGFDPYPAVDVAQWMSWVSAAIIRDRAVPFGYAPTFEQMNTVQEHRDDYLSLGVALVSPSQWLEQNPVCYASGWAVGNAKYIAPSEITAAYGDGRLGPSDILVTDGVPAELPYLAGIITLKPATPNSHVAILAQSYGIPFVYLSDTTDHLKLRSATGNLLFLQTGYPNVTSCDINWGILNNDLSEDMVQTLKAARLSTNPSFPPKAHYGGWSAPAEILNPEDRRWFGGKAAHFGLLRRVIPDFSPNAIAFSFDLWDGFMSQPAINNQTLQEWIHSKLSRYSYPPDVAAVRTDLAAIRDWIRSNSQFTPELRGAVTNALTPFVTHRKIRFRSSTNVEDDERFSGAGLYDSYSGCLGDDLDSDQKGPSYCDPDEVNERGVFGAIQKVYASLYNENAFLERLRLGVDESNVGMAILVHYSTPDEIELANGVATIQCTRTSDSWLFNTTLVSQRGAVSVANPDPDVRAEEASYRAGPFDTNVTLSALSSLVPKGDTVLQWNSDYLMLGGLVRTVALAYIANVPSRNQLTLDLEFKKIAGLGLQMKQVREVPIPTSSTNLPAVLLSGNYDFLPYGPITAVHRLKSTWHLTSTGAIPNRLSLDQSVFPNLQATYLEAGIPTNRAGPLNSWPRAKRSFLTNQNDRLLRTTDSWSVKRSDGDYQWRLQMELPRWVTPDLCPILNINQALLQFSATYPEPEPSITAYSSVSFSEATEETVTLYPVDLSSQVYSWADSITSDALSWSGRGSLRRIYGASAASNIRLDCYGLGSRASYAYLLQNAQTSLAGFLSKPMTLRGEYSQTVLIYGREGHEEILEAIADPWLEPNLSLDDSIALANANIRWIYCRRFSFRAVTEDRWILGLDGLFRRWSP